MYLFGIYSMAEVRVSERLGSRDGVSRNLGSVAVDLIWTF